MKILPEMLYIALVLLTTSIFCWASTSDDWDYFTFSQEWPVSTCAMKEEHTCKVPDDVNFWLIHGLWPSRNSTKEGPFYCKKLPFNETQIKPIEKDMDIYWPNLYIDTKRLGFWEHEWEKHGTCCTDLPATSGELNYFSQALKQRQTFNIDRALNMSNITPSESVLYGISQIREAIKTAYGVYPEITCASMKPSKLMYKSEEIIASVEICMDKTFNAINCPGSRRSDPSTFYQHKHDGSIRFTSACPSQVYYPPISRLQDYY